MLYLPNSFIVPSFLGLVVSVRGCEGGPTVAWCEWVKDPDISLIVFTRRIAYSQMCEPYVAIIIASYSAKCKYQAEVH